MHINPNDQHVLDALAEVYKTRRSDVKLTRACDSVVKAFTRAIPEEQVEAVEQYWLEWKRKCLVF